MNSDIPSAPRLGPAGPIAPSGRVWRRSLRLIPALLAVSLIAGCSGGLTGMVRPATGSQAQVITVDGQNYPVRITRDFGSGTYWTRLVAPDAQSAMAAFSRICDGRAYAAADWPDGRLSRDSATGEWAIMGDCPHFVQVPS